MLFIPMRTIRAAVSRAIAAEGARGWKIAKDKQSRRIESSSPSAWPRFLVSRIKASLVTIVRTQASRKWIGEEY
jgi:hypothetical protein